MKLDSIYLELNPERERKMSVEDCGDGVVKISGSVFDRLALFNPKIKTIEHAKEFFNAMKHIDFEKADMEANAEWYENNIKYLKCMDFHFYMTQGCFEFNHYKQWRLERFKKSD